VVELVYLSLNTKFDMCVIFMINYFLVKDDVTSHLMIDFVNLKIKLVQSFRGAHINRMYVCVHRSEYLYIYEYLCLYYVSKNIYRLYYVSKKLTRK
jgi:hypothetical protein